MSALKYCAIYDKAICHFESMGIDSFLIPLKGNPWSHNYSQVIISKIIENNKNNMLDTVKKYIQLGGDIKKVAKEMYQHENTIRYRLERLKEILNFTGSDMEFFCELSLAVKIYLIENREGL
jgi:sugar diacid utilization regulator